MNARHRKCVAVAISAGVALFLASTAASAQADNQAYPMWYQQSWQQFGPQSYAWGAPQYMGNPYFAIPWYGPDLSMMWRQLAAGWSGASSNIQDMGDYYRFQVSLPGVNPNDMQMRVEGRMLSLSVHSQGDQTSPQQGGGQWQTFFNNYQQVFTLPEAVDSSRMQSHFENGVLTVNLPKMLRAN